MYKKIILTVIILILIFLEIIMSASLIYNDINKKPGFCIQGEGCDSVQSSSYGQIFGIKLAYYSIFAFIFLLVIYFINTKVYLAVSLIGGGISIYLILIQLFVLNQICSSCMIIDIGMIFITMFSFINVYLNKKKT